MYADRFLACKQCFIVQVGCSWKEVKHDNTVTWLAKEKNEKSRKLKVGKFSLYVWGFLSHHAHIFFFVSLAWYWLHAKNLRELCKGVQKQRCNKEAKLLH